MKKIKEYIWVIIFILLLFILTITIVVLISSYGIDKPKENHVGALFIGSVSDGGWNENHFIGLKQTCDEKHLKLTYLEYVEETEDATKEGVDYLVKEGCNIIFLTSDGFGNNVKDVIEAHPDIRFYTISTEADAENAITYYGRIYQMRYLSGIIAGSMTKTNVLGFVAAIDTPQVDRAVNAYLLGARSVNPDAVVKVKFINTWRDDKAEKQIALDLINKYDADVLTYHCSLPNTISVAEENGVYSIGYNIVKNNYSNKFLTAAIVDWHPLYMSVLNDFLKGDVDKPYYWYGSYYDAVKLAAISELVPESVVRKVKEADELFKNGDDVFVNEIYSNTGEKKCSYGDRISDDALLRRMTWFVEGVEVYD